MRAGGGCQGNHVENKQFTNENNNAKSVAVKSLSRSVKLIRCKEENEHHYGGFAILLSETNQQEDRKQSFL